MFAHHVFVAGSVRVCVKWLYNSLGRYEQALAAAQRASDDSPAVEFAGWALVELIEAAVRSGVPERAAAALQRLAGIAAACGTDWVLGAEARSRALVSDGTAAENLYREAIGRFGRTRLRVDLARAHLLHGEWLRRQRRRRDARDQLAAAYQIFDSIGAATVAYHLRKVFTKLGVSSRSQLAPALPARHGAAPPQR